MSGSQLYTQYSVESDDRRLSFSDSLVKKTGVIRELCGVTLGVTLSHSSQEKAYENLLLFSC